jgi:hypothetical protein
MWNGEIVASRADEQASVWKEDLLDDPANGRLLQVPAAVEELLEVEDERNARQRLPVRAERVDVELVNVPPDAALVDEIDLRAGGSR